MSANSNLWVFDKAPLRRDTQQPDPHGNTEEDLLKATAKQRSANDEYESLCEHPPLFPDAIIV